MDMETREKEEIGERIRRLRSQKHMTQTQMKDACGISSGNLSSMENGRSLPSAGALMRLASYFDCTVDYILFGNSGGGPDETGQKEKE